MGTGIDETGGAKYGFGGNGIIVDVVGEGFNLGGGG